MRKPVIGIPADRRLLGSHWFHAVGEKYIAAIAQAADAAPVLLPALGEHYLGEWLAAFDGILFTGSPSNVEPHRYQGPEAVPGTWHDPERDATTLPLITAAVSAGMPVFGICRGFQEMNVAFGGSLCQKLHEQPGKRDHREDATQPLDQQYAPVHEIALARGGLLHGIAGVERVQVNSLHSQGVERLGERLVVEAEADDGVIEAFRVEDASAFALAVQWHPEWKVMENPYSRALFAAFGKAGREHATRRRR
ncbi:MAG TPA: gamma-glutamyl-gamma-aminobutyrate hydrolase family protein [Steroidobacteraceae bacterium]|nr:gamma-glutamyl-gamma-aminobutyrate hydrolase family protein [Steroidobacteraceae bacterium]